ncbi:uncharacterized protein N7484_008220 [Penicillium longicatenatum]|uniref:uncharacterized protein n=1 Tax=Penicillium longicatenatum TaxID=1561947 RepID=UPI00254713A9|nr:uncharacterized protein N7484_008220 [Penicillium longicatenatum]KAJ5640358.1 hypothetical protein N7484_008220 [Penicillium longicatenatum]
MLGLYRSLKHSNVLSAAECFVDDESMFALVNDLPVNLAHLVGCRTLYPTEIELASIAWQVLDGACYLNTLGLEHQSLICRNVLLGLDGIVKIACIESCVERNPNEAQSGYIKALASIIMEVMQKDIKDCGVIGIEDLERWPVDSNAFKFLSAISTTENIEALKEQPLVSKKYRLKGELILLARSVFLSAHIFYSLEENYSED